MKKALSHFKHFDNSIPCFKYRLRRKKNRDNAIGGTEKNCIYIGCPTQLEGWYQISPAASKNKADYHNMLKHAIISTILKKRYYAKGPAKQCFPVCTDHEAAFVGGNQMFLKKFRRCLCFSETTNIACTRKRGTASGKQCFLVGGDNKKLKKHTSLHGHSHI